MKYIFIVLLFFSKSIFAQSVVSYYPWQNMLGITHGIAKNFHADYKIETNSFFNNMNMEFGVRRYHSFMKRIDHAENFIEIHQKATINYGFGIAFNPLNHMDNLKTINGYYLDLGLRHSIPLHKESLYIILEVSPYVNERFTNGNLRTRLGFGYLFRERKRKK
jgi:hypothetical protein